jgi:hypothetical protein
MVTGAAPHRLPLPKRRVDGSAADPLRWASRPLRADELRQPSSTRPFPAPRDVAAGEAGRVEAVLPARASCSFYAADPRGSSSSPHRVKWTRDGGSASGAELGTPVCMSAVRRGFPDGVVVVVHAVTSAPFLAALHQGTGKPGFCVQGLFRRPRERVAGHEPEREGSVGHDCSTRCRGTPTRSSRLRALGDHNAPLTHGRLRRSCGRRHVREAARESGLAKSTISPQTPQQASLQTRGAPSEA